LLRLDGRQVWARWPAAAEASAYQGQRCGPEYAAQIFRAFQSSPDQRFAVGAQLVDNYPASVYPNATMIVVIVES
jgi:hypothetical protein